MGHVVEADLLGDLGYFQAGTHQQGTRFLDEDIVQILREGKAGAVTEGFAEIRRADIEAFGNVIDRMALVVMAVQIIDHLKNLFIDDAGLLGGSTGSGFLMTVNKDQQLEHQGLQIKFIAGWLVIEFGDHLIEQMLNRTLFRTTEAQQMPFLRKAGEHIEIFVSRKQILHEFALEDKRNPLKGVPAGIDELMNLIHVNQQQNPANQLVRFILNEIADIP
ncbi:hypothetical protein D3C75_762360 [compost metagenome]